MIYSTTPYNAKNPPSVLWTATDPVTNSVSSGIQTPAATLVTTEGLNQSVTSPTVSDIAGNTAASVTVSGINYDKTPPVVGALPAPNANGWYGLSYLGNAAITKNNPLKLNFSAAPAGGTTDALSGVSTVTGVPALISGIATFTADSKNTAGTTETVTATDVAGNSITTAVPVKIDTAVPTIKATVTTALPKSGWYSTGTVTVGYTCTDVGPSGIATCPPNDAASSSSLTNAGTTFSQTAIDNAGNSSTPVSTVVKYDNTPPTFAAATQSPAANANGWNNANVTVNWNCTDALSGVTATCTSPVTTASTSSAGTTVGPVTATDKAGNTASSGTYVVYLDKTAPTFGTLTASGATKTGTPATTVKATLTLSITEAVSGVDTANSSATYTITVGTKTYASGSLTVGATSATAAVSFTGLAAITTYTVSVTPAIKDNAGNSGVATAKTVTLKI